MKLSKTYNLKAVNPGLAGQWHPVKNGNLKPEEVAPRSGKKACWVCERGYELQEQVYLQNRGQVCPLCHKEKPVREKSRYKVSRKRRRSTVCTRNWKRPRKIKGMQIKRR